MRISYHYFVGNTAYAFDGSRVGTCVLGVPDHVGDCANADGMTRPPAFVITKPWFGAMFTSQDWNQIHPYAESDEMPVHVVLLRNTLFLHYVCKQEECNQLCTFSLL